MDLIDLNTQLAQIATLKKLQDLSNELPELIKTINSKSFKSSLVPEPFVTDDEGNLRPEVAKIINETQKAIIQVIAQNVKELER
jgi:hypothetical protein